MTDSGGDPLQPPVLVETHKTDCGKCSCLKLINTLYNINI